MKPGFPLTGVVSRITPSAMKPVLIALAIIICVLAPISYMAPPPLNIMFGSAVLLIIVAFILQLAWFTITDADRLQSERHVQAMTLISNQIGIREGDVIKQISIDLSADLTQNPRLESGGSLTKEEGDE
jgi:hypothetical protein